MLHYGRIYISKGIDLDKINNSIKCLTYHYWFFNPGFELQYPLYNGCHDLSMLCLNISDIAIITIKDADYRYIIHHISISESSNLLENSVVEDRGYL